MCRAFHRLSQLDTIKNDTNNLRVCIEFEYDDTNTNTGLDTGEYFRTFIGFTPIQ